MNKCHFMGWLARDPELHTFASGTKKVSFTLKTSRRFRRGDGENGHEYSWLQFEAWAEAAEYIEANFKKGDVMVIDDAFARTESWEVDDGNGGKAKRSRTVFRVNEFSRPLRSDAEEGGSTQNEASAKAAPTKGKKKDAPTKAEPVEEEVPF